MIIIGVISRYGKKAARAYEIGLPGSDPRYAKFNVVREGVIASQERYSSCYKGLKVATDVVPRGPLQIAFCLVR